MKATDVESVPGKLRPRAEISERYRWDLNDIFPSWDAWHDALATLESRVDQYARMKGTLAGGADALLASMRLSDEIGQLTYKVWYFASLAYDEDQRDNAVNARRQQVQILMAKAQQASAWFNPELLAVPLADVRAWMDARSDLALYRFAIEDLYRQQEHVLDEKGEHLLSLAARFNASPSDAYASLSTADLVPPMLSLSDGEQVTLTYGTYRAILATRRDQRDRASAFEAFHDLFVRNQNTYASLYSGVLARDWFHAQARGYASSLDSALHEFNIPISVVSNLIQTTKQGVEALRRYHRLRKKALGVDRYHVYDGVIPLVATDRRYPYDEVRSWLVESVAPLGTDYVRSLGQALDRRWIDVYENAGKRSGAYSAPVYGVHPYMLLNYNDTLDAVFTLAHELGHSMHTMLAHAHQPFVYSGYTIFVAEVPSTLSETLLLDYLLARTKERSERIVLLQHAIDDLVATFYTQVLFADFELQAHRLVEADRPVTADALSDIYLDLLKAYHGDAIEYDEKLRVTWARIPHFFSTSYYVYQYATCYASSAQLAADVTRNQAAAERYLDLLKAGGSDYPMTLLASAGVDLADPRPVQAVIDLMDRRVTELEAAMIS